MKTRINYNQGQVSGAFSQIAECRRLLQQCGGAYMQRQEADTGEWFPCNPQTGAFLDMTAPENKGHPAKL